MNVRRGGLALLTVAAATALGGCGQSKEERALEPVHRYMEALADRDGERACDQMTGEATREYTSGLSEALQQEFIACPEAAQAISGALGTDERDAIRNGEFEIVLDEDEGVGRFRAIPGDGRVMTVAQQPDGDWLISGGWDFSAPDF